MIVFVSHVLSNHRIVVVKVWAVPSLESGVGQGKHETLLVGDTDWDRGGSQQFAITQCRHDHCVQTRHLSLTLQDVQHSPADASHAPPAG